MTFRLNSSERDETTRAGGGSRGVTVRVKRGGGFESLMSFVPLSEPQHIANNRIIQLSCWLYSESHLTSFKIQTVCIISFFYTQEKQDGRGTLLTDLTAGYIYTRSGNSTDSLIFRDTITKQFLNRKGYRATAETFNAAVSSIIWTLRPIVPQMGALHEISQQALRLTRKRAKKELQRKHKALNHTALQSEDESNHAKCTDG